MNILYIFGSKKWRFAWVMSLISTNQTTTRVTVKVRVKIGVRVRFRVRQVTVLHNASGYTQDRPATSASNSLLHYSSTKILL